MAVHENNYDKILKSDSPISALIGQFNWTVRAIARARLIGFFFSLLAKKLGISCVLIKKRASIHKFC